MDVLRAYGAAAGEHARPRAAPGHDAARQGARTRRPVRILLLAGTPLSAELPDELQAGARLRSRVEEVGADRVVLRAVDPPARPGGAAGPTAAGRRPGAARRCEAEVQVTERAREGYGERDPAAVALQYDSPAPGHAPTCASCTPGAGLTVTVGATGRRARGPRPRRGGRPARGAVRGDRAAGERAGRGPSVQAAGRSLCLSARSGRRRWRSRRGHRGAGGRRRRGGTRGDPGGGA